MTKFIAVHSGAEGTGKTTVAINLAQALHDVGRNVLLVDMNFDDPKVGEFLGLKRPEHHLGEFLEGKKNIHSLIYAHASGLHFIPIRAAADIGITAKASREMFSVHEIFEHLDNTAEIVILDCPSGYLGSDCGVLEEILANADESIIVTVPTLRSMQGAIISKEMASRLNNVVAAVVVNKADMAGAIEQEAASRVMEMVIHPIRQDKKIIEAQGRGMPSNYEYPQRKSSRAIGEIARLISFT